ncbi:MAG TPA: hypothetical protein EYQ64_13055 [Gemmatimonadetes bacterium]|nr:hypothetical protein [Gemmatimonadota bacterium]
MSRRASRYRRFLCAPLLVLLVGCHTWQPTTVSPRAFASEERPASVRLTLADGRTLTLKNPVMRNDSIVSIVSTGASEDRRFSPSEVVGVAMGDIDSMEVQRFSRAKTIGFVVVAVLIAVGWAGVATGNSGGAEPEDGDTSKAVVRSH